MFSYMKCMQSFLSITLEWHLFETYYSSFYVSEASRSTLELAFSLFLLYHDNQRQIQGPKMELIVIIVNNFQNLI